MHLTNYLKHECSVLNTHSSSYKCSKLKSKTNINQNPLLKIENKDKILIFLSTEVQLATEGICSTQR